MRFAKRLLMGTGVVALAGLIGTMIAPQAAHALVATLVTVTNSVAVINPTPSGTIQPVITTETDSLSRVPYQDSCQAVNIIPSESVLQCTVSAVPAGKRLVIEEVTALCHAPTGKVADGTIATLIGSSLISHVLVLTPQDSIVGSPGNHYAISELVRFYSDPGSEVYFTFLSGDAAGMCSSTLSGYLEPTNIQ
jgi:hypothetical protein